ncbi:MAG: hypothetical protein OEX12_14820 [Gammaproteobacteria bacterium]|nr:hypothetical protein [Gammaproteobacteria bacterium]
MKMSMILLMMLMASCGLLPPHEAKTIKELLPLGSTLHLTADLEIPAGRGYVYIAHGQVVTFKSYNTVDIYKPHCMFRLHQVAPQGHTVRAGRFKVIKIVEVDEYYGRSNTIKLASTELSELHIGGSIGAGLGIIEDAAPSASMYATVISLQASEQPEVKDLVCGHWDTKGVVEPLTLAEMQEALGLLLIVEK